LRKSCDLEFSQEVLTAYQDTFYDRSGYLRSWPLGVRGSGGGAGSYGLAARARLAPGKRPLFPMLLVR